MKLPDRGGVVAYCVTMSNGERLYLDDEECGTLGYERAVECARVQYVRTRYPDHYGAWMRGAVAMPEPVTVEWVADHDIYRHDMSGGTAARISRQRSCASQAALSYYLSQPQRIAAAPTHTRQSGWRVIFTTREIWEVVDPDKTMDEDEAIDAAYHALVRTHYAIHYEEWKAGREDLPIPEVDVVDWVTDILVKADKPKTYSLEFLTELAHQDQGIRGLEDIFFVERGPL